MDLLNRPQSSSSRPAEDALHTRAYASGHIPGDAQHPLQPQAMNESSSNAVQFEGRIAEGMPAIQGGLGSPLDSPLAGQSPERSVSPLPLHADGAWHKAELCPGQRFADAMTSHAQPDSRDSFSAQRASPLAATLSGAAGMEAEYSPGGDSELRNRIQSDADAGYSEAQLAPYGLSADEAAGSIWEGGKAPGPVDAPGRQQAHNPLAEIDAATWARLPAIAQARILAGEAVNLEAAIYAREAAGPAPQVLLHTSHLPLKPLQIRRKPGGCSPHLRQRHRANFPGCLA